MYIDGVLSVMLVLWLIWLGLTAPMVVRRASLAMGRGEFEMMFAQIVKVAGCLFLPYVLILVLLLWRFASFLWLDFSAGHAVLWFIVAFLMVILLLLHCLVNAVYYVACVYLGANRD